MAEDPNEPHIYGGPDPKNDAPPPEQGLRGEGTASEADAGYPHTIVGHGGKPIEVCEQNGVSFAEVAGTEPETK